MHADHEAKQYDSSESTLNGCFKPSEEGQPSAPFPLANGIDAQIDRAEVGQVLPVEEGKALKFGEEKLY